MKLVAIECAGAVATLCLADGGSLLEQRSLSPRNSAAEMVPALAEMLAAYGWRWPQVEAIAVTSGPGSFTGIRVGLATAKGLAEACDTSLLAVSSLALLADQAPELRDGCALMDAGRGEFYARRFRAEYAEERLIARNELLDFAQGSSLLASEKSVVESCAANGIAVYEAATPDASGLARYAASRLAAGERSAAAALDANYLRRSDAEVKRDAGLLR